MACRYHALMDLSARLRPVSIDCTSYDFLSSRRRHTRLVSDWSSDVCSSDLRRFVMSATRTRICKRSNATAWPLTRRSACFAISLIRAGANTCSKAGTKPVFSHPANEPAFSMAELRLPADGRGDSDHRSDDHV